MSFTADVKKEIISRGIGNRGNVAEKKAAFSAFVRTSGLVGMIDGAPNFFLVSETENVAEFFTAEFAEIFSCELSVTHATMNRMSGRDKLVLQCPRGVAADVLSALGLLKRDKKGVRDGIAATLVKTDACRIAYIKGAFLGGGSCTLPSESKSVGYHLEIVFSDKKTAADFCLLLADLELIAKLVERKETFVVYIKSKEAISDFLAVIGAENALKKFTAFVEKRDASNNDNRAKNCFSGNADKTAIAAVKQVVAIQKIRETTGFAEMSAELVTLAKARLANPTMSLKELSQLLGVGKSCLNHRMRKLLEISEEI